MACFTRQDLKDVYDYMKSTYIDKGVDPITGKRLSFEDIINKTAKDLGRNPEEMAKVLTTPKTLRTVSNETYRAYANRRRAKTQAEAWLNFKDAPPLQKAFNALMQTTFATRVLGHGPVSFGVHAAPYLYMPTRYPIFMRNYLKAWGNLSDVQFEKMSRTIEGADDFRFWNKHSKGAIDPAQHLDDMQAYADWASRYFGKAALPARVFADLSRRGSQQFQGIKQFRLEMMRDYWKKLSPSLQTEAAADRIGDYVNHMTGVSPDFSVFKSRVPGGKTASNLMFAPSLEVARWQRLGDVMQTFADLKNADPGVRRFALSRLRDYMEMTATYTGALAMNNAWLAGSGQRVNFNDPNKYDWLSFKRVNGDAINATGGEIGTVRFIARELMKQRDAKGKVLTSGPAFAQFAENAGKYGLNKLSPFAGTALGVYRGSVYGEGGKQRPLPVPWAPPPSKGTAPYTIPEYLAEQQAPIPVSGAAQSILSDIHHGKSTSEAVESGIIPFLVEGIAGGRMYKK